jgi:hypothetical protein
LAWAAIISPPRQAVRDQAGQRRGLRRDERGRADQGIAAGIHDPGVHQGRNRRGGFERLGQPEVEGHERRLDRAANDQEPGDATAVVRGRNVGGRRGGQIVDRGEIERAVPPQDEHRRDQEGDVAQPAHERHPVGASAGSGPVGLVEQEPAEANARQRPGRKHHAQVARQHEHADRAERERHPTVKEVGRRVAGDRAAGIPGDHPAHDADQAEHQATGAVPAQAHPGRPRQRPPGVGHEPHPHCDRRGRDGHRSREPGGERRDGLGPASAGPAGREADREESERGQEEHEGCEVVHGGEIRSGL